MAFLAGAGTMALAGVNAMVGGMKVGVDALHAGLVGAQVTATSIEGVALPIIGAAAAEQMLGDTIGRPVAFCVLMIASAKAFAKVTVLSVEQVKKALHVQQSALSGDKRTKQGLAVRLLNATARRIADLFEMLSAGIQGSSIVGTAACASYLPIWGFCSQSAMCSTASVSPGSYAQAVGVLGVSAGILSMISYLASTAQKVAKSSLQSIVKKPILDPKIANALEPILQMVRNPEKQTASWPRLLLSGLSGMGKTAIANMITHESQMDYAVISGRKVSSLSAAECEQDLQRIMKADKPSILVLDDADSFRHWTPLIEQVEKNKCLLIVTTEDANTIPDWVLSRIDYKVHLEPLGHKERRKLFKSLLVGFSDPQIDQAANRTEGFSCRRIYQAANALMSVRSFGVQETVEDTLSRFPT